MNDGLDRDVRWKTTSPAEELKVAVVRDWNVSRPA
ncbi:hypothetical protein FB382_001983 [Nocardioides ginsengisegetis]|uniref:Uncharacterized protein n=1 Tax=Nocardioides ginsengisegetis TaxID=661491 RepID=A0A7W3IZW0_9ACTN|nr:hypothetical protein [Nocardioides ginsengisegetis]